MGLGRYLKEALMFRWNLLILGGASAAALISGHVDVALPLVAAAEVAYLAGLATHPKFQAAMDAKASGRARAPDPAQQASAKDRLLEVIRALSDARRHRFLRLRARCTEMQRIANAVRGETRDTTGLGDELRLPALDRLLWMFLRLLLSQQAIERFLQTAGDEDLAGQLAGLRAREAARLKDVGEAEAATDRMLRSLRDSIATVDLRQDNLSKAHHNAEFVAIELDRIEAKIHAIAEMAVANGDPDMLSAQVDAVAEGMTQTEATIRELQTITGLAADAREPAILGADIELLTTGKGM